MNPPSEDIKDILAGISSLALIFGTDLHVAELPKEPDQCVAIYDSGGYEPQAGYNYERPTIQIMVRGEPGGYCVAQMLAQNCRDELHGLANYTINAARYIGIWCEADVTFVGFDENRRPSFSVNFRIHRTNA